MTARPGENEIQKELAGVVETLAERAHEHWAQQRMQDGWTWGPERDDRARRHPCLVPYGQLPESERDYDRRVAIGVLKALLELGYRITREGR